MKKTLPVLLAGLLLSAALFGQTNLMSAPGDLTYTQVVDSIFFYPRWCSGAAPLLCMQGR